MDFNKNLFKEIYIYNFIIFNRKPTDDNNMYVHWRTWINEFTINLMLRDYSNRGIAMTTWVPSLILRQLYPEAGTSQCIDIEIDITV